MIGKYVYILIFLLLFSKFIDCQESLVFAQPDDPIAEIAFTVLEEAYNRIGIEISSKTLPAERSLILSNNGVTDGEVGRVKAIQNNYPNLVIVPVSINLIEGMVFTKELDFEVKGWESLRPFKIGYRRGTKFAENATRGMNVVSVSSNDQSLKMLSLGRVDLVVMTRVEGYFSIKQLNLDEIKVIEPPLVTLELFHFLHKKNESVLRRITEILEQMEEEGRIEEIRDEVVAGF